MIDNIDFGELYRQHVALAQRQPKPPSAWDERAAAMADSCADPDNPYVQAFIAKMDLSDAHSLLDVGCGPATISLPLAKQFEAVYGLDYSPGMLAVAADRAQKMGVTNFHPIQKSWEDDWADVPECDIVVASRSTMCLDMAAAINQLNQKAKKRVYTTHTVDQHFLDPHIVACIGRDAVGFPNYIYTVNLLAQMGYLPKVDYIQTPFSPQKASELADFIRSVSWSVGPLTAAEEQKLTDYFYHDYPNIALTNTRTWAFVSWDVRPGQALLPNPQ
ncbi:MAG: class I SAM-dependent methyltransferase [Neisseriaceae bacterium]|nr:class I SAM-dependent methyltransferase [Neisseriaceae bacterium]MBP6860933.1 class I SAM-dependent methyltransferase [Neisseriaceae bacterium]